MAYDLKEMRVAGLFLARMGASLLQLADAEEAGDQPRTTVVLQDLLRLIAGLANFSGSSQMYTEITDLLPEAARSIAKYIAPAVPGDPESPKKRTP